jgi:hypothetical protein
VHEALHGEVRAHERDDPARNLRHVVEGTEQLRVDAVVHDPDAVLGHAERARHV